MFSKISAFSPLFSLRYSCFSQRKIPNFQTENPEPGFQWEYWLEIAIAQLIFVSLKKGYIFNCLIFKIRVVWQLRAYLTSVALKRELIEH
jgi:hypothetical protein